MDEIPSIGIIVTAEQIPLLRDVIVTHHLDVFICDTQDTQLLDDHWKPWLRRVRPQRTHCTGEVWLIVPTYAWPRPDSHARIRQIIAEQLHTCIQMAVILNATGIVIPIEHAQADFHERIHHYLTVVHSQLTMHSLKLMLLIESPAHVAEVQTFITTYALECTLLLPSDHHIDADTTDNSVGHKTLIAITSDDQAYIVPELTKGCVLGAHDSVSVIRKKLQSVVQQFAQRDMIEHDADTDADTVPPEQLFSTPDDEVA